MRVVFWNFYRTGRYMEGQERDGRENSFRSPAPSECGLSDWRAGAGWRATVDTHGTRVRCRLSVETRERTDPRQPPTCWSGLPGDSP